MLEYVIRLTTTLSRILLHRQSAPRGRKVAAKGNALETPSSGEITKPHQGAIEPPQEYRDKQPQRGER